MAETVAGPTTELTPAPTKRMRLRYSGLCRRCGVEVPAGVVAIYDKTAKNVTCVRCADKDPETATTTPGLQVAVQPVPEPDVEPEPEPVADAEVGVGVGGASARREHERRKANDDRHIAEWEGRVRAKHPVLGGLVLAVADKPQNPDTRAWDVGAHGEEAFAKFLDKLAGTGLYFLHDRRIPPGKTNIDHIVIAPTGVYVIDAKNYTGRPTLDIKGGIFAPRVEKLRVGGRDRTKLVDGVHRQVQKVRELLERDGIGQDVPVRGMLCFVHSDWPLIGGSFAIGGLDVLWPQKARKVITAPGPLPDTQLQVLHRHLAAGFPSA